MPGSRTARALAALLGTIGLAASGGCDNTPPKQTDVHTSATTSSAGCDYVLPKQTNVYASAAVRLEFDLNIAGRVINQPAYQSITLKASDTLVLVVRAPLEFLGCRVQIILAADRADFIAFPPESAFKIEGPSWTRAISATPYRPVRPGKYKMYVTKNKTSNIDTQGGVIVKQG